MYTMFIAALFTISRAWKPPRCTSTEEWIKEMWYLYTMEYYSAIKNEIMPCSNMHEPRDYHLKCSKPERKRQISYGITYIWI